MEKWIWKMRILVHEAIFKDIKKCCRKKWYPGIDEEFPRVLRLLKIKCSLPGEAPFHHLPEGLHGETFHAKICLPKVKLGKRTGPRIIYHIKEDKTEVKVLYIGGHKDRIYNTDKIIDVLVLRFISGNFYEWSEKKLGKKW